MTANFNERMINILAKVGVHTEELSSVILGLKQLICF